MATNSNTDSIIQAILHELAYQNQRLVLAESCTAGLAAAKLAQFAGVSNHWCGSWVTYRDQSKIDWLGVSTADIQQHTSVSKQVTEQMALQSLQRTAEAHWSAAITGHLGPNAPTTLDGQIYIAIACRNDSLQIVRSLSHQLIDNTRLDRQHESVYWLFVELSTAISDFVNNTKV